MRDDVKIKSSIRCAPVPIVCQGDGTCVGIIAPGQRYLEVAYNQEEGGLCPCCMECAELFRGKLDCLPADG